MATAAELQQLDDPLILQISDQMQQGSSKTHSDHALGNDHDWVFF